MVERRIPKEDKSAEKLRAKSGQKQCSETVDARQTDKRLERIRARASYRFFKEVHDFLESKPKVADILVKLYDVLDDRRSFGSIRNAAYAAESLGLVLKDSDSASKKIFGNFYFGEFFADVKCLFGHEVRLFNIGRGHFFACDKCRTYILVGSNLMQCWREENEGIWRKNSDSVNGYKFIE
jgi:hypothetical protein